MNPIAICVKESGKIVGYACEKCNMMSPLVSYENADQSLRMATECCSTKICEKHGVELRHGWSFCDKCTSDTRSTKEAEKFSAATKIKLVDYKGEWLYSDGFPN